MITPTKEKVAKGEKLGKSIAKDLNDIVDLYFNNYDPENYDATNLHWKKHCNNINRRQKLVIAELTAFETRVAQVVSENPQFQIKEETIDFTKL